MVTDLDTREIYDSKPMRRFYLLRTCELQHDSPTRRRQGVGDIRRGLFEKFQIERTDGKSAPGQKHYACEYFVLDLTHDSCAPPALAAYEQACYRDYPLLAADLQDILLRKEHQEKKP